MNYRIAVIVPAWNEERTISETIDGIRSQELSNAEIVSTIVVANNCTDSTADVARQYNSTGYRPVTVLDIPNCPGKKAGAMNIGWRYISSTNLNVDFVFTMDADTVLESGALQGLIDEFAMRDEVGAVCSRYLSKDNTGLVRRLQALEYARFDDARKLRGWKVQVASGAAVMYRQSILNQVVDRFERTGPWDEQSLIEDYGLTLDIKTIGLEVRSAENSLVLTDTPTTWKELWKQRTRWGRGGIDECRKRGWTPATRRDISGYGVFALSMFLRIGFITSVILSLATGRSIAYSLIWLVPQVIMWLNRVDSTRSLRNKSNKDRLLVYPLFIEDMYGFFMEAITIASFYKSYRSRIQSW